MVDIPFFLSSQKSERTTKVLLQAGHVVIFGCGSLSASVSAGVCHEKQAE